MKSLFILSLIILSACKSSTSQFDSLPQADRDYIQTLAQGECRKKVAPAFQDYKDQSDEAWDSTSYEREDGFHQEFLDGTTVVSKVDLKVWKVDATDIYFYVTETLSSTVNSYFLKINRVTNTEIIDDLAEDYCIKKYTVAGTGSTGPLAVTQEFVETNTTNTDHYDHYKDIYTLDFSRPAFLGPYRVTRTITTTDRNGTGGTVIGTAKSFKTTYVAQAYNFTDDAQYNTVNPNNGTPYYTQNFCVPAETTGEVDAGSNPVYRLYRFPALSSTTATASTIYRFGFNYTCTPTTIPAGWDLSIVF